MVNLSVNDNIKFLENINQEFKRTISWNEYRSKTITHPKSNNLICMIDPIFRNINILFALSYKNDNNDPKEILLIIITCRW